MSLLFKVNVVSLSQFLFPVTLPQLYNHRYITDKEESFNINPGVWEVSENE
jgi:hypothetical protein